MRPALALLLVLIGSGCTSDEERALRALLARIDAELAKKPELLAQLEALRTESSFQSRAVIKTRRVWDFEEKLGIRSGELKAESSLDLAETLARRPVLINRIQNRGGRWTANIEPLQTPPRAKPPRFVQPFDFSLPQRASVRWGDEDRLIEQIEQRRNKLGKLRALRKDIYLLDQKLEPYRKPTKLRRRQADLMRAFFEHREKTFPDLIVVRNEARFIVTVSESIHPTLKTRITALEGVELKLAKQAAP